MACAAAKHVAAGMCLQCPSTHARVDVTTFVQSFYLPAMPTPTEAARADGAVTGSTLLNKNPTVYSPYSPSSVTYKYPDGTDMTHFSLAYLAGK